VSCKSPIGLCDAPMAFEQPTACEEPERDMPDAIVDVLEADIRPGTGDGDVAPWAVPPWALTSRTSKRSGDASGGRLLGISLGEGSSQAAGVHLSSVSCGRSGLHAGQQ
jgi:hypothetical protein